MGGLVADQYVPVIQTQLNVRFHPGDQLDEMIALQKEFDIFSSKHSLASAASLLNLAPQEEKERRGWFAFLLSLKKVKSDKPGTSGHDRIVSALRQDLTAKKPMPVFFKWHPSSVEAGVTIEYDKPLSFSATEYLVISVPTRARGSQSSKKK